MQTTRTSTAAQTVKGLSPAASSQPDPLSQLPEEITTAQQQRNQNKSIQEKVDLPPIHCRIQRQRPRRRQHKVAARRGPESPRPGHGSRNSVGFLVSATCRTTKHPGDDAMMQHEYGPANKPLSRMTESAMKCSRVLDCFM